MSNDATATTEARTNIPFRVVDHAEIGKVKRVRGITFQRAADEMAALWLAQPENKQPRKAGRK
jgi:hypothetical protein